MSFFKRLFGVVSSEAHSALDKVEDPVKMTEQGLRVLKEDLAKSLEGLASVKAVAISTKRELENYKSKSSEYERKAMQLLQGAQTGLVPVAEADRLASEALTMKTNAEQKYQEILKSYQNQEAGIQKMEQSIQQLRSQIANWENEAKSLKARAKVSEATAKINKTLANIDSDGTVAMLQRMKEKVDAQEALAESYGSIADSNVTVDEEINKALLGAGTAPAAQNQALLDLKAKMGLLGTGTTPPPPPTV